MIYCQNYFQRFSRTIAVANCRGLRISLARTKNKGPFAAIRELLKNGNYKSIRDYPETGILEIELARKVVITPLFIEGMKESGYILQSVSNSVAPELIDCIADFLNDIEKEDDVPEFICTTMRFKDTNLPPLENSEKSDIEALRMEPLKAELVAAGFESACSDCEVDTEGEGVDEDDIADE